MKNLFKSFLAIALATVAFTAVAATTSPANHNATKTEVSKTATKKTSTNKTEPKKAASKKATQKLAAIKFGITNTAAQPDTLNVSKASYQKFANALGKQLNAPVKLVSFSNQTSLMNAVAAGKVDIAIAKVVPFVNAQIAKKNIQPLATVLSWNQNKTQKVNVSSASLVTLASNPVTNKTAELKNAKVAFARDSASGFYFPSYYLQKNKDVSYTYHFYNNQYDALQALKQNKVSIATIWDKNFNTNKTKFQLKTIKTINNIPNPVIIANGSLSAAQQANIKQALMTLPANAYTSIAFAGVQNYNSGLYATAQKAVRSVKGPAA